MSQWMSQKMFTLWGPLRLATNFRHSVSSPDETPRSSSKILRCASYFHLSSRCFIWWWNTASHVWYITYNVGLDHRANIENHNLSQLLSSCPPKVCVKISWDKIWTEGRQPRRKQVHATITVTYKLCYTCPYQIQHCFECIFKLFLKTVFNLFCEIAFK